MRLGNRNNNQLRHVSIVTGVNKYAEGSCLVSFGDTKVMCNATVEKRVPLFLKGSGKGWVTAEYSMLPRSTDQRVERDVKRGAVNGRASEIQRLIGRSLRSVVDMSKMGGEYQIIVDCDVIQADGGTRTASITGGFVAMILAFNKMVKDRIIRQIPVREYVAAVSAGVVRDELLLDLDYNEDSNCKSDVNFVLSENGGIVEIQGTAEAEPFSEENFMQLFCMAKDGINDLIRIQKAVLKDIF